MEKKKADRIIMEYLGKIYGFAVKKSFCYDEAEDLASEIVAEVYRSLLVSEEVCNIEGYVWRISEHVFAKYVSSKKKHAGISIDGMEFPDETDFYEGDPEEEMALLRREIAFLTRKRREVVYAFYYENQSISDISKKQGIPEGTVKWHLNKAKNDLKEGYTMKRSIGKLGLKPIEAMNIGHDGRPGDKGGPEYYLTDKLNLNIVYSVYSEPKTKEEIAQELGMTLVFIEDRVDYLEANGFLVRKAGGRYTTYVDFSPESYSRERNDKRLQMQEKIAALLVKEYVPLVRAAFADEKDMYVPGGNRELFEAAMIFCAVQNHCKLDIKADISKYFIKTTDGGNSIVHAELNQSAIDPDYRYSKAWPSYSVCGMMNRVSDVYSVGSCSVDTRYTTRSGGWENNRNEDYEYLYEVMSGMITEDKVNEHKFKRLRERGFLSENGEICVTVVRDRSMMKKIPPVSEEIKKRFASYALEYAMECAKEYPPQMRDLIVHYNARGFVGSTVALMVWDMLYADGTFRSLTEKERAAAGLIVFSDVLPKDKAES